MLSDMDSTTAHTPASLRARLDLSQEQVASRASEFAGSKVSTSTVRRLECGRSVGLDHLRAIAAALAVTVDVLIEAMDTERARRAGSAA